MHVFSVVTLSLAALGAASPLNLEGRASCKTSDINILKKHSARPVQFCESWLSAKSKKKSTPSVSGLSPSQVKVACECVTASAKAAITKKTSTVKKSTVIVESTTKRSPSSVKTSLMKPTTKTSSSTKKVAPSTKKSISNTKKTISTTKKTTSSTKKVISTARPTSSSTKKVVSSSKTSSKKTSTSRITSDHKSTSRPVTTQPATMSSKQVSSTRKTTGRTIFDYWTTKAPPSIPTHAPNTNLIKNGNFEKGVLSPWGEMTSGPDVSYDVRSLSANTSCSKYQGSVNFHNNGPNDWINFGFYQPNINVTTAERYLFSYDLYLNYPTGIPEGLDCYMEAKDPGSYLIHTAPFNSTGPIKQSFETLYTPPKNSTGNLFLSGYCESVGNQIHSPLSLGVNNVRFIANYDGKTYVSSQCEGRSTLAKRLK